MKNRAKWHRIVKQSVDRIGQVKDSQLAYELTLELLLMKLLLMGEKNAFKFEGLGEQLERLEVQNEGLVGLFETLHSVVNEEKEALREPLEQSIKAMQGMDFDTYLGDRSYMGQFLVEVFEQEEKLTKQVETYTTPASVRALMSTLLERHEKRQVYDPAIGTGSLALEVALSRGDGEKCQVVGQDLSSRNVKHCKTLMVFYGMEAQVGEVQIGDSLDTDNHKKWDTIVSVPPFGTVGDVRDVEMRFISHVVEHLAEEGMAVVLINHGLLFKESNSAQIRTDYILDNVIDAVIQLPAKMLRETPIATSIVVFKKKRDKEDILFMDLSGEVGRISKLLTVLSDASLQKIGETYSAYKTVPGFSKVVSLDEVLQNDGNLMVNRYVETVKEEEVDLVTISDQIEEYEIQLLLLQEEIRNKLQGHCK